MLTKGIKSGIRSFARRFGLDIRRISEGEPGIDPQMDLKRLVGAKPRPVIFDVGANVGQTVDTFRATFPNAVIHSFEPGGETFQILKRHCAGVPDVHLNNVGVGAEPGVLEFIESVGSDMSSFLEPTVEKKGSIKRRVEVSVITLDEYCQSRSIPRIDILKVDTQGFDYEVLKGAERLLSANAIHCLCVEITFSDLYKNAARLDDIFGFLVDRGMKFVTFYRFYYRDGRADWTDALFVNPSYIEAATR